MGQGQSLGQPDAPVGSSTPAVYGGNKRSAKRSAKREMRGGSSCMKMAGGRRKGKRHSR